MNFDKTINILKQENKYRELKYISKKSGNYILYKGKELLNLASNDYLGISSNKKLYSEFYQSIDKNINKFGAVSSRLLSGNYEIYKQTEDYISNLYNKESCIIYNSGYHANTGILPALTTKNDLVIADKLVHASIIDGIKLSDARFERYRHLDYNHLENILNKKSKDFENIFIVSESIFSMDGDKADLHKLISLKKKYNAYLYVDEAHAFGVCGEKGLGLCEQNNLFNDIDIIVGTFGKAIASVGAFVVFNEIFAKIIVNKSRSLIYTTALPPINLEWTLFILKKLSSLTQERKKLKILNKFLVANFKKAGIETDSQTHIIPVLTGDNEKTILLQQDLMKNAYFVSAVRPPTVPVNTSRIRISLSSSFNEKDFDDLLDILKKYF